MSDIFKRNLYIEILRIISMFMIILGHCIGHSHLNQCDGKIMAFVLHVLKIITLPATNIFVLISSYFLASSQFQIKRICNLYINVLVFSLMGGIRISCFTAIT